VMKNRNRLQIIHDILNAIRNNPGNIRRTHILYKSNLNSQMLDEYLKELIANQLVVEQISKKKKKTYALTNRSYEYLSKYQIIDYFKNTFNLS
jgi:predicted transcriptional regulator